MSQYLTPGVYIEEVPGAKPIGGVGTATGAFVGIAEKGPIGSAQLITNWTQYLTTFGGFIPEGYLAYAVNQFFKQGGTKCWVVRTCHYSDITDATKLSATRSTVTLVDRATSPLNTLKITAQSEGSWGDQLLVVISDASSTEFDLTVYDGGAVAEQYKKLTIDSVVGVVNKASSRVTVTDMHSTTVAPGNRPASSLKSFNDLHIIALARDLTVGISAGTTTGTFKLTLKQAGAQVESHDNLTMSNVERRINGRSDYITVLAKKLTGSGDPTAPTIPTADTALIAYQLSGGWDGLKGQTLKDTAADAQDTLAISAWRDGVSVAIAHEGTDKFSVTVKVSGATMETYPGLTMATVEEEVNTKSAFIEVNDLKSATAAPNNRPAATTVDLKVSGLSDSDFVGDEGAKNGLHAFDIVDDINIVAIPDRPGDREIILEATTYCKNRGDCFYVADVPAGITPMQALQFKQGQGDYEGNAFNSSYGALYYPWVYVSDPLTGDKKLVPPSGGVVGVYSNTDVNRGVHKAPAGQTDGYLNSAVAIERKVSDGEQELLNPENINVIRSFPSSGIVVWGARTLSADAEWTYINVRRLLLFIEESIDKATQWVVFEPNDISLWAKVKRDVTAFLNTVWQAGMLFGITPDQAFFVKVDAENNPEEQRNLGRLFVDIGIAPVKPAEFVVFRITQITQGASG